jgi:hypothetical protein
VIDSRAFFGVSFLAIMPATKGEEIMFTKRHYERIARTVAETGGKYEATVAGAAVDATREYIAKELADLFAEDNPRFNRKMFLAACDVTEVK